MDLGDKAAKTDIDLATGQLIHLDEGKDLMMPDEAYEQQIEIPASGVVVTAVPATEAQGSRSLGHVLEQVDASQVPQSEVQSSTDTRTETQSSGEPTMANLGGRKRKLGKLTKASTALASSAVTATGRHMGDGQGKKTKLTVGRIPLSAIRAIPSGSSPTVTPPASTTTAAPSFAALQAPAPELPRRKSLAVVANEYGLASESVVRSFCQNLHGVECDILTASTTTGKDHRTKLKQELARVREVPHA